MINLKSIIFFVIIVSVSCSNKTKINSKDINDKNDRIAQLKSAVILKSKILDAEYDLFNVNGFNNDFLVAPGSSSSDYKYVIKVETNDTQAWIEGLEITTGKFESEIWAKQLIEKRKDIWKTQNEPIFYKYKNYEESKIIMFRNEGIIFKHVSALN